MKDKRDWKSEYEKLKLNFDRLDRMNDVLYRYWYTVNKPGGAIVQDITDANKAVTDFMEELQNERKQEVVP